MRRALLLTLLVGCVGKTDAPTVDDTVTVDDTSDPFSPAVTRVVIEVDYADGAEPYTGSAGFGGDYWDLFELNAEALVGSDKERVVPHELSEMQAIGDQGEGPFDVDAILAIADAHRDTLSEGETASYYAVWLDGYFADDSGTRDTVIGVSIGRTRVIAMFKPVVNELGLLESAKALGEQATLIHELGHAVGLVNNGLPLTADHHDAEHGAHCTNEGCVMYWANEGAAALGQFMTEAVGSEPSVLFDDDCLADVAAARD